MPRPQERNVGHEVGGTVASLVIGHAEEAGPPRSVGHTGFGFAVGEAVQRVNDACTVDAVCQGKNILGLAGEYFDPRVTLFTAVLVIVAAAEASFFFYQSRLKRQVMQAAEKAAANDRQLETETRALIACLQQYDLEHELTMSLNDAA